MPKRRSPEDIALDQDVADRLNEAIGTNVSAAARKLGISPSTLDNYAKNRSRLDVHVAAKIAQVTGRDLMWLLTGNESAEQPTTGNRPDGLPSLLEIEDLLPVETHSAITECIELLALEHPAAQGSRDVLARQVTILLRDARRLIEDSKKKDPKPRRTAEQRVMDKRIDPNKKYDQPGSERRRKDGRHR